MVIIWFFIGYFFQPSNKILQSFPLYASAFPESHPDY